MVRGTESLDILSVKKEARLSARALAKVQVGRGKEELRCTSLFMVCQRRRGIIRRISVSFIKISTNRHHLTL